MPPRSLPTLEARAVDKRYGPALHACRGVSLAVRSGEVLGVVGESGSGKSTLLRCLSGALRPDAGWIEADLPEPWRRRDIWSLDEASRAKAVRETISVVHQNPRDGLRMEITNGGNITEPLMARGDRHFGRLRDAALTWLDRVELPRSRIDDYPAQLSGGMQQRLQIARALISSPRILLMDEPTGGLDVSVQAKLLDLLRKLVRELDIAVILVTHDLAVVRMLADRLIVMRNGEVVESGLTDQVLDDPQHAYSQALIASALRL